MLLTICLVQKYFVITSTSKKSTEVYVLETSDLRKPLRLIRRREDGVQYYVEHNHVILC